jgi:hypothetical protein
MIAAESLAGPWFECPRPVGLGTAEQLPPLLKVSAMAVSFAGWTRSVEHKGHHQILIPLPSYAVDRFTAL